MFLPFISRLRDVRINHNGTVLSGVIIFFFGIVQAQEMVVVKDNDGVEIIGKSVRYFDDSTANLSIHEIISSYQKEFQSYDKDVFTAGGSESATWFKMLIKNETGEDLWLQAGANAGWHLGFYRPNITEGNWDSVKTGALMPEETKEFPSNFYWFKLADADETEPRTYYLRLETGLNKELPLFVGTLASLSVEAAKYDYLSAGFAGLVVVMILYNLFLAFATRDKIYLTYVAYLVMTLVVITLANGFPLLKKSYWLEYFFIWSPLLQVSTYLFSAQYLNLKRSAPIINWFAQALALYMVIIVPATRLLVEDPQYVTKLYQFGVLLFYLTLMYAGIYLSYKKIKNASYYVLGWVFNLIGYVLFFLTIFGVLPYNLITRNVIYFGTALEVILFSFALANRLNVMRREKEEVQLEKLRFIQEQNEKLEKKVNERTAEIHHRVKNNLQMISSMLSMQQRRMLETAEAQRIKEAANRINIIGLLHEHLYRQTDQSSVELKTFLEGLVNLVCKTVPDRTSDLNLEVKGKNVSSTLAIYIGLILNELMVNSFKHARPKEILKLHVNVADEEELLVVNVRDNGVADNIDVQKGFGLTLIETLLQDNGELICGFGREGFEANVWYRKEEFQLI